MTSSISRVEGASTLPPPSSLSGFGRWLVQRIIERWKGPADLPPSLRLELRFVAVRWLGIVFLAPVLPLTNLSSDRLTAAYVLLALTAIYNVAVEQLIRHRPHVLANGYVATLADTLLDIAMVTIGGGFDSPFYYIVFTVTISAAMRFGYGPSLATALIFVTVDTLEFFPRVKSLDASLVFRSGFLCLTAILASYLREQAHRAEQALQERLRQASLLNEATAMLGASLELEQALQSVAAAASHLLDGASVLIQPSPGFERDGADPSAPLTYPPDAPRFQRDQLRPLCQSGHRTPDQAVDDERRVRRVPLATGDSAIVVVLALPTRQASLAVMGLAAKAGSTLPDLDMDILEAFVERCTLALENAFLYRTLASRSDDLQRAFSDLAAAHQELLGVDEMKTSFLANVSHELRTPLTSIRGFSELLLTYDDAEVQKEFLHIINSESERLTRLVNDVLDITKIESGYMEWRLDTFDLTSLLVDTGRSYEILTEREGLEFHQYIEPNLEMYGDSDRLQQVVSNLLTNALKFTRDGSIELNVFGRGENIEITVKDTGVGIAFEDQARIFEKFQQVGATLTDKPRGTGLGLAICKDIVQHHGGDIWVDSRPGQGSTFSVRLPRAAAEARSEAPLVPETQLTLAVATV